MAKSTPNNPDVEFEPDAWQRFERAVTKKPGK
jgi:hypothetical protein